MKSKLDSVARWWNSLWFFDVSASELAIFRIVFFGVGLWVFGRESYSEYGAVSPAFWRPISFLQWLCPQLPSETTLSAIELAWRLGMIGAAIGLFTRISMAIAALSGAFLIAITNSFGIMHHDEAGFVITSFAFCLSHAGQALSVDAWIRKRLGAQQDQASAYPGEHALPIAVARFAWGFMFTAAGVAKIQNGGSHWFSGEILRDAFVWCRWMIGESPLFALQTFLNQSLAQNVGLLGLGASLFQVLELAAIVAFLVPKTAKYIVTSLALMQVCIFMTMFIPFKGIYPMYLAWIPWGHLWEKTRSWGCSRSPA